MARTSRFTDGAVRSNFAVELPAPPAKAPPSDALIDSFAAGATLADEPIPDHLVQLALKLARVLDSET